METCTEIQSLRYETIDPWIMVNTKIANDLRLIPYFGNESLSFGFEAEYDLRNISIIKHLDISESFFIACE